MKKSWLLGLVLLSCQLLAFNEQSIYDYDINHWDSTAGLSSNSVRTVSQDQLGYIWFGTVAGLNRFDGSQFEHFTPLSHRNLASNTITQLRHDSRGYMWVGTKSGLSGFNPLTLKFDRYQILSEVTAIVEVRPGEIWVAADSLFRVLDGKVSRVEQVKVPVSQIEHVNDQIWLSSAEQIFRLDLNGNITSFPLPAELIQTPIYDLRVEGDNLLIAGETGFYHLDSSGVIKRCQLPDKSNTAVYKLFSDSNNNRWISAHRKLFHQHTEQPWQAITVDELGHYPWFSDIFEDREKNIWLTSFSDGIYRASASVIKRITPPNADPVVRSVGVTPADTLLLAGQSSLGELHQDGQYTALLDSAQLGAITIHDVYWPSDNELWLATDNGVLQYQRDKGSLKPLLPDNEGHAVRVLKQAAQGGVFMGSVTGLYHYQNKELTPFVLNAELESRHITALRQQNDLLIIGTTRGVYSFQQQQLIRLGVGTALYNSYITSALILPDNTLLIATLDDGIFIRRPEQDWQQLHDGNGLPHGPVVSMTLDSNSHIIWVSSHKGIFRIKEADLPKLDDGFLPVDDILGPYDRQLGTVPGRCCNGAGHAKVALWREHYWYPTLKGVVAVPSQLSSKSYRPLFPVIKGVSGSQRYTVDAEQPRLVLELNDRNLTIEYSALEFIKPDALQFRYRLQGFDKHWHVVGNRREAIYTNLQPGQFNFELQVKREGENWRDGELTHITLVIPKRFDETLLYRGLWLLLLLFCLYGLLWLARRNTVHKQQQLERLVRQRTQELENSNLQLNELNEQLALLTHKDNLTGLRNRRFMFEQLPKDIEHFQRNRDSMLTQGKCVALLHLDLDNFKNINDQYGNAAGDSLIQQVASLLIRETRGSDYVVRFAGEEFVLVLRDIQRDLVTQFCENLNELFSRTSFNLPDGHRASLTCSIGYALYPLELLGGQLINWEISLQLAEMALYQVKHAGKNGIATIEFDQQVDAFEFEDSSHIEAQVERLLSAGLAHFQVKTNPL